MNAILGEGPVWHDSALWAVDIVSGSFHRISDEGKADVSWRLGTCVTAAVPCRDNRWIILRETDAVWFDPATGTTAPFAALPSTPRNPSRFNDAKCDARGRLWAGTMTLNAVTEQCGLYRLGESTFTQALTDVTSSNGLGWSPDNRWFYYVDSALGRIDRFAFDADCGVISERRPLARFEPAEGIPDGLTVDAEGHIWVALWGGASIWRIDGASGARIGRVAVPVTHVTSCTFGGPGLRVLYITTAMHGLDAIALTNQPTAGGIFTCEPRVSGLPANLFAVKQPDLN